MNTLRMRRLTLIRQLQGIKEGRKLMLQFVSIQVFCVGVMLIILWAFGTGRLDWLLK